MVAKRGGRRWGRETREREREGGRVAELEREAFKSEVMRLPTLAGCAGEVGRDTRVGRAKTDYFNLKQQTPLIPVHCNPGRKFDVRVYPDCRGR